MTLFVTPLLILSQARRMPFLLWGATGWRWLFLNAGRIVTPGEKNG